MTESAESTHVSISDADTLVGIVVALPEELRTLTDKKLSRGECCRVNNTWICYSGTGMTNAADAARSLIDKGVKRLLSWGCAAGLAKHLKPGDLIVTEHVISERDRFDADASWREDIQRILDKAISVKYGPLFTSAKLISRNQDKQKIHHSSQAVALDMESAAIAEVAANCNVPFIAIRSIADPANMDLPRAVQAGLNDEGQVELPKLLRFLFCHPWEIVSLIRLGLHFRAAQQTLKFVAKQLGIPDSQPAAPIVN
ncbi:phosphorylase family protein [Methylomonas sp. MgM2]